MMKRIIALLLALILTVGLLPTVALAAKGGETPTTGTGDVKNGYYEATIWKEGPLNQGKLPTGVESVSKTAKPTSNPNEYEVTLEVVLKKTESQENPGSAATVLVLDHSGSMNGCAYCKSTKEGVQYYHTKGCKYGKGKKVTSEQSRMSAATEAVKDFIKTYSGRFDENGKETATKNLDLGRWVCLVWFNETGGVTGGGDWVDVSNKRGYETATNTNGWKAHDGTNLDCGLRLADYQLKKDTVAKISKNLKNVIVLSDGEPTYHLSTSWEFGDILHDITIDDTGYYVHGNGGSCDEDTYNTTKSTAATLRNSASVYTVCFGASKETIKDYDKNGNQTITVGDYLKQKIATQPKSGANEKFAYNAADADALNTVFAAISKTIVSGLSTGTVKDTLPTGISSTVFGEDETVMNWELNSTEFTKTEQTRDLGGGKKETVFTYTKTYTVTIDPDKVQTTDDGYAPLNGETTLTVKSGDTDVEIPFPIPAGKVTPTKITDEITVTITGATNTETYDGTEKKAEGYTVTISDPRYTTNDFTFSGTNVVKATNASDNQYMMGLKAGDFTNNNEKFTNVEFVVIDGSLTINKKALTIEANDNTVDYDGKPHGEDGYVATGLAEGDTVESVTFNGSQTNPGTYENLLVPSEAVIKNAKGDDVKDNYIITYTPGTLVINKLTNAITVTITGKQETKEYNGQTQEVVGFTYTVEGAEHDDVTVTLKTGKEAKASGKDVLVGTDGTYDATRTYPMNLTADDFNVSSTKYSNVTIKEVNDGWLKITPIAITLKSGDASKTYDGTALTNTTVNETGAFVTGEGLTYNVTGSQTVVGTSKNTYNYAAKAGTTLTNYTITKEEGNLTVTLPDLTARPNVIVNCVNTEVPAHTEKNTSLTNADHYTVSTEATKVDGQSAYTRTITLTEAGKNHFISSEYVPEYGSHTPATNGNVTEITMTYSEVNGEWAWRASHANFLLNVECTTPTVEVDLGNYIKKTLTGTNFHENFSAEFKVDVAYSCDGDKTAVGSVTLTDAAANTPFNFDKITLKQGFYYIFTVREQKANVPGVICDTTTHEFALNVKTDGNVEFGSVVDKQFVPAGAESDKFLTITNTYTEPKEPRVVSKTVVTTNMVDTLPPSVSSDIEAFKNINNDILYPVGNGEASTLEVPYGTKSVTLLYKITVNAGTKTSMQFEDVGAERVSIVDDDDVDVSQVKDTFTVQFYRGVTTADIYVAKTYTNLVFDSNGECTVENAIGNVKATTTVKEKDPNKLYINFADFVKKELTATGSKTASDVSFRVIVNGMESPIMMYNAGEEEVSTYVEFDPRYSTVLDVNFASITGGSTETKDFTGSYVEIDQVGIYYFELNEEDGKRTGVTYDDSTYKVYVYVKREGDKLVVGSFDIYKDGLSVAGETITFHNTIDTGKDDYYPIIIPTIINKDTGMLNKTDHFAYVIGYPDGTVHPNGQITRAEVATIFFRLLRDEVRDGAFTTSNSYSDVAYGKWYNNPISTMSALGIITGYPDGTFKPNKPITRAEFAAIAARFDETQSGKSATFSDVIGHWAAKEIGIAYYNDWIKGYPDGTFKPDQNITRAEAMTLINRVLERKPESPADLLTNMNKWTDNMDTSKWYYLDVQEATNSHGYTRKTFNYELWRQMLPDPDWSRYER